MLCEWAREGMGVTHNCSSSSSYSETCSQASPTSSFWSFVLSTNKVTGGGEGLRTRWAGSPYLSMGGLMYSHMPSDLTSSSCLMHETKASRDWISVSEGTWWERDTLHVNIIVYTVCTQHGERCYSVSPHLLSHNAPYFCTLCGKSITSTIYMTTTSCITWHHMTSHELHTWHHMTSHELHTWHHQLLYLACEPWSFWRRGWSCSTEGTTLRCDHRSWWGHCCPPILRQPRW